MTDRLPPKRRGAGSPKSRPSAAGKRSSVGDGQRPERALSDWAEEIYTAPPRSQPRGDIDAQVTVSTRLRKPRVHLTAPSTVQKMDIARYMGRWHEIARLPYFTQRRCTRDVHADYRLGDDGMVYITNRCRHADGSIGTARGLARVLDPTANTRLQISFRMLYGVHVLWDDYWVIGLGEDYEYALVGQPSRRRGWVLARDPQPAEPDIQRWLAEFEAKGFPAQAFERTQQSGMV